MNHTTAGLPLAHAILTAPPLHIPDGAGGAYKTELVICRSPERTEKINWWHGPDPRRDPHNHPWHFDSHVLAGALTMTLWRLDPGPGAVSIGSATHRAGVRYHMPANVFHTVDAVEPGTVTHMVCGPLVGGGEWGYLVDGVYERAMPDESFVAALRTINPHLRGGR